MEMASTLPRNYAQKLVVHSNDGDLPRVIDTLREYDWAVATQTAEILQEKGLDFTRGNVQGVLQNAASQTKQAFSDYFESLKN